MEIGKEEEVDGRGEGEKKKRRRIVKGRREVIVKRRAVVSAQRHVDDVDGIRGVAIAVRIDREVHSLDQADAAAGVRVRGTDLDRVQIHFGRNAATRAADDIGDVRAVTAAVRLSG